MKRQDVLCIETDTYAGNIARELFTYVFGIVTSHLPGMSIDQISDEEIELFNDILLSFSEESYQPVTSDGNNILINLDLSKYSDNFIKLFPHIRKQIHAYCVDMQIQIKDIFNTTRLHTNSE